MQDLPNISHFKYNRMVISTDISHEQSAGSVLICFDATKHAIAPKWCLGVLGCPRSSSFTPFSTSPHGLLLCHRQLCLRAEHWPPGSWPWHYTTAEARHMGPKLVATARRQHGRRTHPRPRH